MACKCIEDWNKQLKEKFNETATVNCEVLSGRVIVNGIYHKPKFKGKPGEYQQKWEEVMLWPKYCPFCGKPYDVKDIYGQDAVTFADNLICTQVELEDWYYDEEDQRVPRVYRLVFRFHDVLISSQLYAKKLQTNQVEFSMIECDGDLLKSFEDKFEYEDFSQKIREVCQKHWEEVEGKDSIYKFNGLKDE